MASSAILFFFFTAFSEVFLPKARYEMEFPKRGWGSRLEPIRILLESPTRTRIIENLREGHVLWPIEFGRGRIIIQKGGPRWTQGDPRRGTKS